jgi:hypothetical protein
MVDRFSPALNIGGSPTGNSFCIRRSPPEICGGPSVVALIAINFKDRMYTGKDAFICCQRPDRNMSAPLSADLADQSSVKNGQAIEPDGRVTCLK